MSGRSVRLGLLWSLTVLLMGPAAFASPDDPNRPTDRPREAETAASASSSRNGPSAPDEESLALPHFHRSRTKYDEGTQEKQPHHWPDDSVVVLKKSRYHLDNILRVPDWLHLGLHQRTRYETLNQPYQKGQTSGEHLVALQTLPTFGLRYDMFRFFVEGIDARTVGSSDSFVGTNSFVDQTDLLQLYGGLGSDNFLGLGLSTELTIGRQTFDFGSRRLIGRNLFRNTVNAFDGVHWSIGNDKTWQVRTFAVAPVQRLTVKPDADAKSLFWGVFLAQRAVTWAHTDLYVYVIEDDTRSGSVPGLKRSLSTPGFRMYKEPAKGEWDYEAETIWQVGKSAVTPNSPAHSTLAHLQHLQIGYTFDLPWRPNLLLRYDYVSGTRDPNGNTNGRFDTLFGPTNFEFTPAGIFEPFSRSNISSPAWKLTLQPTDVMRVSFQHRIFWLAQSRDQWVNTGLQDSTGRAGNFLGHFFDARGRWYLSSNLSLESGWCYLVKGDYTSNLLAAGAPGTPTDRNANYVYVQTVLNF